MPNTGIAARRDNASALREHDAAYARMTPAAQVQFDLMVAHRWAARAGSGMKV